MLDINEVIHVVNMVVIHPRASRIIKGWTSLVLFGTKMNVATEPLKGGDLPLPRGCIYGQATLGLIVGARKSMLPCTT